MRGAQPISLCLLTYSSAGFEPLLILRSPTSSFLAMPVGKFNPSVECQPAILTVSTNKAMFSNQIEQ